MSVGVKSKDVDTLLQTDCISDKTLREGRAAVRRVCFVCTGNTCRSPMAEAVANYLASAWREQFSPDMRDALTPPVEAYSAGLYPAIGDPISENAVLALEKAGILPTEGHDYRLHRAREITAEWAERFDLLVAVSPSHAMELMLRFPQLAHRITLMPKPISDPWGGDVARYRACLDEIVAGVKGLLFSAEEKYEG